jgi:1,4-dihydroxy-2-naphthoate octaprenyltransferase
MPIAIKSGMSLKQKFDQIEEFVPIMKNFVSYSRITGVLLVVSFVVDYLMKIVQ